MVTLKRKKGKLIVTLNNWKYEFATMAQALSFIDATHGVCSIFFGGDKK